MANGLNRTQLLGNLGLDPELKYTANGLSVLGLRVATTVEFTPKGSSERKSKTEWHSVSVWGKRGEALSRILKKGDRIYIEGSLANSSWEAKDGTKKYGYNINATEIILCGGGGKGGAHEPAGGYGGGGAQTGADGGPPATGDDIPF